MISQLEDFLFAVAARPGMYLATQGLAELRAYVAGYLHAVRECDGEAAPDVVLFAEFEAWMNAQRGFPGVAYAWDRLIQLRARNDYQALHDFFTL